MKYTGYLYFKNDDLVCFYVNKPDILKDKELSGLVKVLVPEDGYIVDEDTGRHIWYDTETDETYEEITYTFLVGDNVYVLSKEDATVAGVFASTLDAKRWAQANMREDADDELIEDIIEFIPVRIAEDKLKC